MSKICLSGIYCIKNLSNNKIYVGQSLNLNKRKYTHFRNLNMGIHPNKHLQASFNKYGKENFEFKILIYCEQYELSRYEQFFVDHTPIDFLYNECLECTSNKRGVKTSEETKLKLSKNRLGKTASEESKRKMSESRIGDKNHFYGKHHTEETKMEISKSNSNPSIETRLKLSKQKLGKQLSEETKNKISLASSGENNGMYGKHHSEESKRKITNNKSTTKLNDDKVMDIINKLLNGYTIKSLGEEYGVSFKTISKIKNNQRWKHIMPEFRQQLIKKNKKKENK